MVKSHDIGFAEFGIKRLVWRIVVDRVVNQENAAVNLNFLKIIQKRRILLMLKRRSSWKMNRLLILMHL